MMMMMNDDYDNHDKRDNDNLKSNHTVVGMTAFIIKVLAHLHLPAT